MSSNFFDSNDAQKAALAAKIHGGDPALIDALLRKAPLHSAMSSGDIEMAKALVGLGATVNARRSEREDPQGRTPLDDAMAAGQVAAAEWIHALGGLRAAQLPARAFVADAGASPAAAPAAKGQERAELGGKRLSSLSARGPSVERPAPTASAARAAEVSKGEPALIDALIDNNPLHSAIEAGSLEAAKILVGWGASLDSLAERIQGAPSQSPLDAAIHHGRAEIGQWLASLGAKSAPQILAAQAGAPKKAAAKEEGAPPAGLSDLVAKVAAKRVASLPAVWTIRDEAFWRGDAKKFKEQNRMVREARAVSGLPHSELDAACDSGDVSTIRSLLSKKREALGMSGSPPRM